MHRISNDERRRRMVLRHHLDRSATDVAQAVADTVAMHSSDPLTPYLALRARVAGLARADIEDVLYEQRLLWRMHAMRRTIFLVVGSEAEDLYLAAGRKIAEQERRRVMKWVDASLADARTREAAGIDGGTPADSDAWFRDLEDATVEAIEAMGGEAMTTLLRASVVGLDLSLEMGSGKYTQTSPLASRLLYLLAMEGRIVRGRPAGTWRASQYAWSTADGWFGSDLPSMDCYGPGARPPTKDEQTEAAVRVAERYLRIHGPATLTDVLWFFGWTKTLARMALGELDTEEVETTDGAALVLADDLARTAPPDGPVVTFVPSLDPAIMGWKQRTFYLADLDELKGPLFDYAGNSGPAILVDGWVVGGWSQRKDTGEVVYRLLRDVDEDARRLIAAEATAVQDWIGEDPITTRFRAPLDRELSG